MADIELNTISSGYNTSKVNDNFETIQDELNNNVMKTDGSQVMTDYIDMNSNRIVNVADAVDDYDAVAYHQVAENLELTTEQAEIATTQAEIATSAVESITPILGQYDNRLTAIEESVEVADNQYIANYSYVASGGETTVDTSYDISYAILTINGIFQSPGYAYEIDGTSINFSEELSDGDVVYAVIVVPYATATDLDDFEALVSEITDRVSSYETESTEYLINTFDGSDLESGDIVKTLGYYSGWAATISSPVGGGKWVKTGNTGTASQYPSTTGDITLFDSVGNEFKLTCDAHLDIEKLGLDGETGSSAVINKAFETFKVIKGTQGIVYIDAQITVPKGCSFEGGNGVSGTFTGSDGGLIYDGQFSFYITCGEDSSDYWNDSAIILEDGARLSGVSIWYPNQAMGVLSPTHTYSPAISIERYSRGNVISDVNLGNSYIGIDAQRTHGNLYIDRVVGFPLYKGIRIGSMQDNDYVGNVHFSALRVLYSDYGDSWVYPNIVSWVASNGTAVELARVTWSDFKNIFAINYAVGIHLTNTDADTDSGIDVGGSPKNINISSCGFDTVSIGILGDGEQSKFNITDCNFVPRNTYETSATGCWAIHLTNTTGYTTDCTITNARVWSSYGGGIYLNGQGGSIIKDLIIYDFGANETSSGVELSGSAKTKIIGGSITSSSGNTSYGVNVSENSDGMHIRGVDIDVDGAPISISATDYTIVTENNIYNSTVEPIQYITSFPKYNNHIHQNIIDTTKTYTDTDIDEDGVLNTYLNDTIINYDGTTTISGIRNGYIGKEITIILSDSCTIEDADGFDVPAQNRLYLAGDFAASSGDTIKLICRGGSGWVEVSRSIN